MTVAHTPIASPATVALDHQRGLAIIDVDEVLALFIKGFDRYIRPFGYEFRLIHFGLFNNIFEVGAETPADRGRAKSLYDSFFAEGCGDIDPAPGAVDGLRALSDVAGVVILTNAPETARQLRMGWLRRHGMDYPMLLNEGPKGAAVKALADRTSGPVLFVDDLLHNLDSVADHAPRVVRVQMVADQDLRPLAPASDRHRRIDDWSALADVARREVFI